MVGCRGSQGFGPRDRGARSATSAHTSTASTTSTTSTPATTTAYRSPPKPNQKSDTPTFVLLCTKKRRKKKRVHHLLQMSLREIALARSFADDDNDYDHVIFPLLYTSSALSLFGALNIVLVYLMNRRAQTYTMKLIFYTMLFQLGGTTTWFLNFPDPAWRLCYAGAVLSVSLFFLFLFLKKTFFSAQHLTCRTSSTWECSSAAPVWPSIFTIRWSVVRR